MSDKVQGSPKAAKEEENATPMDAETLAAAIRKQVEYYFSKENLQQDAYLTSHMDASMSVPIAVIMKFSKMRALTQDESVIIKALENSSVTVIDGRIKANVKSGGRSTIILRDIPSDATEEEVREIFVYEGCKPISSIKSEIGDTWFVVMESEEDAKDTLIDLRLKKRTFRGQAVKGRMKSETIVRSFYPMQTAPVAFGSVPFGFPPSMGMGFGYGMMPNGMPGMPTPPVLSTENLPNNTAVDSDKSREDSDAKAGSGARNDKKVASSSAAAAVNTQIKTNGVAPVRDGANSSNRDRRSTATAPNGAKAPGSDKDKKGNNGGRNSSGSSNKKDGKAPAGPAIEITPANFPPLMVSQSGTDDTPIPTPGYKTTYTKYSFDDVINIVKSVQDTTLPASIKPAEHPLSMTTAPNLDLLQRQRTFSIDETREQLRQGRPVQQMAVASGSASDYSSMMYGDGYSSDAGGSITRKAAAPSATAPAPASAATKKAGSGSWAALVATPAQPTPAAASSSTPAAGSAAPASGAIHQNGSAPAPASGAAAGNSWKRGDKVPAPTDKAGKTPEKKAAAPANDKKEKKGEKAKKDSKPKEEKEGAKDESADKSEVPSSWGGKPTFANILKTQQEAEANGETVATASPTPSASTSTPKKAAAPADKDGGAESAKKERGGSRGGNGGNSKGKGGKAKEATAQN